MFVGFVSIRVFDVLSYTFCLVLFCLGDLVLVCSFVVLRFDLVFWVGCFRWWLCWLFGFGGLLL